MESTLQRTRADISLDHLAHNLQVIRKQVGDTPRLLAVVKADAYGHGAVRVARHLAKNGASYFAVSNCDEAEELRTHGIDLPILILGYTPPDQISRLLRLNIVQCVPDRQVALAYRDALQNTNQTLCIHLKLDTGMGRLGFQCDDAHFAESLRDILDVLSMDCFEAEGIFTHFAVSDEAGEENDAYTLLQHERFLRMIKEAEDASGHRFKIKHCANSGAIVRFPQFAHDMVRCGIILYGAGDLAADLSMKPVMTFRTTVAEVKEYAANESISYGRTYFTDKKQRIAVLPVGYADGLFRTLSGKLTVRTSCGTAPQTGRICMDMCMIDATALPDLKPGDDAEIFGEHLPVGELAKQCGTIPYELLCAVSKRVPRYYYSEGACVDYNLQLL